MLWYHVVTTVYIFLKRGQRILVIDYVVKAPSFSSVFRINFAQRFHGDVVFSSVDITQYKPSNSKEQVCINDMVQARLSCVVDDNE